MPSAVCLIIDDLYGIFCEGRYGRRHVALPLGELDVKDVRKGKADWQLIEDYGYWFWNFG